MYLLITSPSGFEKNAKKEAKEILREFDSEVTVEYTYFKGVLVAELEGDREKVLRNFGATDTSYINRVIPLESEFGSIDEVRGFFEKADIAGRNFAVRCERRGTHPFSSKELEMDFGAMLKKKGGIVDLEGPEALFLVQIIQDRFFAGVARQNDVITKRPAVGR